jgi:hypothetical protein
MTIYSIWDLQKAIPLWCDETIDYSRIYFERVLEVVIDCFEWIKELMADIAMNCSQLIGRVKEINFFQRFHQEDPNDSKLYLKRVATNLDVLGKTIVNKGGTIDLPDVLGDFEDSPLVRQKANSSLKGHSVVEFFRSLRKGSIEKKSEEESENEENVYLVNPYYFSEKQDAIENALVDAVFKGDIEKMNNLAPKLECGVFRSVLMVDAISDGKPEFAVILINTGELTSQSDDYGIGEAISSGYLIVVNALYEKGYITDEIANKYFLLSLSTLNIFEFLIEHRKISFRLITESFEKAVKENRLEICKALLKRYVFSKELLHAMKELADQLGNADIKKAVEFYC